MYESSVGDDSSLRSPGVAELSEAQRAKRLQSAAEGCCDILDRMVDPAIEMCIVASESKQRLVPNWDREVFIINVMTYLQVRVCVLPSTLKLFRWN